MTALDLYREAENHIVLGNFTLAKLLYLAGDELTTIEAHDRELEGEHVRPTLGPSMGETEVGP